MIINSKRAAKFHELTLEEDMIFFEQIKAAEVVSNLSRLMASTGGPVFLVCVIICSACSADGLGKEVYRKCFAQV